MTITKGGYRFEVRKKEDGKVRLSYLGNDETLQFITWLCDDESEAADMMEAVIDPARYADDEYRARHIEELFGGVRW